MSILNIASDGLHSVLIVIYKYLLTYEKKVSKEKLIAACAPESISDQEKMKQTLRRWIQFGLFMEDGGDVSISKEFSREAKNAEVGLIVLPRILRGLILKDENNEVLWGGEEASLAADFTRVACWVLAQDVFEVPGGPWSDIESYEARQFQGAIRALQNDTRWNGFKLWAPFLGFGWRTHYPKSGWFVVDPTVAVRETLPSVFGNKKELPQETFFNLLSEELPVVDGGKYRIQVENMLLSPPWQKPKSHEVSSSLSRALKRLEADGILELRKKADSKSVCSLTGKGGTIMPDYESISHLIWKGANK